LPGALQAHFGSAAQRWQAYRAAGAVGTITISLPRTVETPWAVTTANRLQPSMSLADPALDDYAGEQVAITMNPARANLLFEGSGHTFDEIVALEADGKPLPRLALPARVSAKIAVTRGTIESQNAAGILRGSDPARAGEYVVISAHIDHLGVGAPVNGDSIYNGAMDNASGIASMLEVAARMRAAREHPARSIVFIAVTGEEKGELGSRYFAAHPTVPRSAIVANVNTDMFLPLFPLKELMVLGLDESDLGGDIRAIAAAMHIQVQADPEPQRNRFVRSDQYSFIKAGIPALAMKLGYETNTPEAMIAARWNTERYHQPSDDLRQPVDKGAADTYIDVVRQLALRIANRPDRPKWNDSSFFKRFSQ
jgi:Zn-dependent M28 family amino/carboxypeptidase